MSLQQRITEKFQEMYEEMPAFIVRAPGRVNIIGEHTDYNDGFVLPMAIDRAAWIALRPRYDRQVSIHSLDFDETQTFDLDDLHQKDGWLKYLVGSAWVLTQAGYPLLGWEGVMAGDVPFGSGLSSSAALEMATIRAFCAVSGWEWRAQPMALLGQKVENDWLGLQTGIMDQMISAIGKADHAMMIDCRTLQSIAVPLPPDTAVIILDTSTRRELVDSEYNERRETCERASVFFGVKALRDLTLDQFNQRADELDDLTRKRARHVISENERTLQAAHVMRKGDATKLGDLMNASHNSLRDDYEVTNFGLDTIVEIARTHPACFGARMTGAGFGGCAVALVQADQAQPFTEFVANNYTEQTSLIPKIYICQATNGANTMN